jgi:transcriptional antiterminator/mannitol/fructose-specific phosphotransferase system IIA component (Ntr-type)
MQRGGKKAMKNVSASKKELILNYLVNQEGYLSIQDLTSTFKISQRTLYYVFETLNQELRLKKLEPIQNVRSAGYYLKKGTKEKLRKEKVGIKELTVINFSKDERCVMDLALSVISTKKITVEGLAEIQNVSRNTVLSDIHSARKWLEDHELQLLSDSKAGYQIIGNEEELRWWFYEFIENNLNFFRKLKVSSGILDDANSHKWNRESKLTVDWLEDVERLTGKHFSDDTINVLSHFIPFVMKRINEGNTICSSDSYEAHVLRSSPEYAMVQQFLKLYNKQPNCNERELFYFETLLLSSQINFISSESNYAPQKFTGLENEVNNVINRFQHISGIRFSRIDELRKNLYIHLLACYYRVKYGVNYKNRLLKQIKKNYDSVFSFTDYSIRSFEDFCQRPISEDEISLISLYFGAEIDRQNRSLIMSNTAQKVLLVCSSGIGTANILKQKLQSMFPFVDFEGPITERDYMKRQEINESAVISTVSIPIKNKKIITVRSIPDQQDLRIIAKALAPFDVHSNQFVSSILDVVSDYAKVTDFDGLEQGLLQLFSNPDLRLKAGGYQPMLSELLTKDTVQVTKNQGMNWKDAIQKSAAPLLKKGKITSNYIDAMIDVVNKHGPFINIGKGVALAHARPEKGVKHLGMSLLKLDKPVDLVNEQHPVILFFTLAAVDDTAHLKALSELATLLGKDETLEHLLSAKTKEDLLFIISEEEQTK